MQHIEVEPAFGRDYKSAKLMLADWNADKDFRLTSTGQYINKPQADEGNVGVVGRYMKSTRVCTLRKRGK